MKLKVFLALSIVASLLFGVSSVGAFFQQPYTYPTTIANPFYVQYARVDGSFYSKPNVLSATTLGATYTLTTADSGSLMHLDKADGIVVTLPAPAVGLYYDFIVVTTVTSNAYKLSTGTQGTDWIVGSYLDIDTDTSNALAAFSCNGSSHDNFSMNGTTTGGLKGSYLRIRAVSSTLWVISGQMEGSSTVATSCATS